MGVAQQGLPIILVATTCQQQQKAERFCQYDPDHSPLEFCFFLQEYFYQQKNPTQQQTNTVLLSKIMQDLLNSYFLFSTIQRDWFTTERPTT